jgi:hypothetical protein
MIVRLLLFASLAQTDLVLAAAVAAHASLKATGSLVESARRAAGPGRIARSGHRARMAS